MRVCFPLCLVVALVALGVWPASAQSTYVSAAIAGDVLRSTHSETVLGSDISRGGEAFGFALRVGTPLGSRWGVELEFARGGEIETDFTASIPLASRVDAITWSSLVPGSPMTQLLSRPVSYSLRSAQRHNTLSTTVWMNQELSQRVSLVYLAGMGFYRSTSESEARFGILPPELSIPGLLPTLLKTVSYGVRPLVGFEARIDLTEHVELVPGVRLHGLDNAWLVRPAVGLAWNF
jgi:hypothetical protein